MKRLTILVFLLIPLQLFAIDDALKGVYRLYDFDCEVQSEPAPKGYTTFYVSHYGRHGARFINSEDEYQILYDYLHKFDLTPFGGYVRDRFDVVYPALKGRAGDLSEIGKDQQRTLAVRMLRRWPSVFRRGCRISAESSVVPRCILSMSCFCNELSRAGFQVMMDVNASNMSYLKVNAVDRYVLSCSVERMALVKDVYSRIFSSDVCEGDMWKFVQSLYYFICHLECVGLDDGEFKDVFTAGELETLHNLDNAKFHHNCGAPANIVLARPQIKEMVESANLDLRSGKPSVRLRFGHDNTIMTILCLISVGGWGDESWDCSEIPMAANIQLIFAKNRKGHVIAKMQLNESDLIPWTSWNILSEKLLRL